MLWNRGSRASGLQWLPQVGSVMQLSGSRAQVQLLCGMWNLPGPGITPRFSTLVGGLFTTEPPGKFPVEHRLTKHSLVAMMPSRGSHMQPYPLVALCLIFFSLKNTHVIVSHTTPVPLSPHGDKDILSASCASAFLSRTCSLTSRSYSHLLGDSSFNRASH